MSEKVLIIDDDPTILQMFKLALKRAGFETVTASNGQLGVDAYKAETPDLCLIDIAMPGMDGYQVIEAIRNLKGDSPRTPIVVLTAHEAPVMREYAKEMGVELYLTKPVRPATLVKEITALLGDENEKE